MILTDDAFAQLVAEEVKNQLSPSQRETLLAVENWDRWKRALMALTTNLVVQIVEIEANAEADENRYSAMGRDGRKLAKEAQAAYATRKARIERFKFHVAKSLDQVAGMIETGQPIADAGETANFYRRAIIKHRELMAQFDMEDTAIDRALWGTLENKWEFDRVTSDAL